MGTHRLVTADVAATAATVALATGLSLNHDELWDADADEIGEAIVRLAVDNPDLLLQKISQVKDGNNSGVLDDPDAHSTTGDTE